MQDSDGKYDPDSEADCVTISDECVSVFSETTKASPDDLT